MEIAIDIDDSTPIFHQLILQIKHAVKAGIVKPGDALPSIRQLANDLSINNKTVAKAYQRLERDCVIESRGYRGTYVHSDARSNCKVDLSAWVNEELDKVIKRLREGEVTDSEIRKAFSELMNNRIS